MSRAKSKQKSVEPEKPVNPGRHEAQCSICTHPQKDEIEAQFIEWANTTQVAKDYSISRDSIYRHAKAKGLHAERRKNVRAALERIIEKAGDVEVNAAAVVSAVTTYARINAQGQLVERTESVNLNNLFDKMSAAELDSYAREGKLPIWFTDKVAATGVDGGGMTNER